MLEELGSLHTPEEVAQRLRVSRRKIYHLLTVGMLAGVKVGQGWRISENAVRNFLQVKTPSAEGGSSGGG